MKELMVANGTKPKSIIIDGDFTIDLRHYAKAKI